MRSLMIQSQESYRLRKSEDHFYDQCCRLFCSSIHIFWYNPKHYVVMSYLPTIYFKVVVQRVTDYFTTRKSIG